MDTEERVVAVLPLRRLVSKDGNVYVARIQNLGLTAYGSNEEEATRKVKEMFAAFVVAHRKCGTLKTSLDRSSLEWCWESELCRVNYT